MAAASQPRALPHAAVGLYLPDDVGMASALSGIHVEARHRDNSGCTLLRLGPYSQARHTGHDVDRLDAHLAGQADMLLPGVTLTVNGAPFDVSDHHAYRNPYERDALALLAAAIGREDAADGAPATCML